MGGKNNKREAKDPLLEWLRSRIGRGRGKKPAKGLAVLLGKNQSQVTRILQGRPLLIEELRVIERYLAEKAPGQDDFVDTRVSGLTAVTVAKDPTEIPVVVIIAPAVWRETGVAVGIPERVSAVLDDRLVRLKQYACTVEADPSRIAICVPYRQMRQGGPEDGDLVHVVRTKGMLEEHTLRLVRMIDGDWFLSPEKFPADAKHLVKFPAKSDKEIEVRGLVIFEGHKRRY